MAGRLAWSVALIVPIVHFALSIVTGRANEQFFAYVVPVNILLLGSAIIGLLAAPVASRSADIDARLST